MLFTGQYASIAKHHVGKLHHGVELSMNMNILAGTRLHYCEVVAKLIWGAVDGSYRMGIKSLHWTVGVRYQYDNYSIYISILLKLESQYSVYIMDNIVCLPRLLRNRCIKQICISSHLFDNSLHQYVIVQSCQLAFTIPPNWYSVTYCAFQEPGFWKTNKL